MRAIFESYTAPELKRIIRASNITNYSKLKKEGLIDLMMRSEHIERFKDLQPKEKRKSENQNVKLAKLQKQLNREFKKKSKPYQQKKSFQEDSKKIEEKMNKLKERMKNKKPVQKTEPLKLKQAPPEKKKRKYTKKPKPLLKGQKKISVNSGVVSFD